MIDFVVVMGPLTPKAQTGQLERASPRHSNRCGQSNTLANPGDFSHNPGHLSMTALHKARVEAQQVAMWSTTWSLAALSLLEQLSQLDQNVYLCQEVSQQITSAPLWNNS